MRRLLKRIVGAGKNAVTAPPPTKFNMGCGYNKLPGYVNVDAFPTCSPDVVYDLETLPWPWADSVADQVLFNHSLEHMGQSSKVFLGIVKELYRICKDGAEVLINVPHPRHDHFIGDPTHVRPITPLVLSLFDKEQNDRWKVTGASNTPLAHYLGVNFKLLGTENGLDERYYALLEKNEITPTELEKLSVELNNVIEEYRFRLVVIKH